MSTFFIVFMELYKIIPLIIGWLVYIILTVYYNYIIISMNFIVNHPRNAAITTVTSILFSGTIATNLLDFLLYNSIFLTSYWILFDIGLNLKRGLPLQYIGKKSVMDRLLRKYAKGQIILCKILVFLLTVIIYKLLK